MTTATGITVTLHRPGAEPHRRRTQWDVSEFDKVPPPKYRFAAPSLPWPWMDFNQDTPEVRPLSPGPRDPWSRYPQSHFGNWTPDQVNRCRMLSICADTSDEEERTRRIPSQPAELQAMWEDIKSPDKRFRVRALFVENMTTTVLQMLGARYDIEPFFFASSANWIPSRYQEDPIDREDKKGDHITVVLPFIRTVDNKRERETPLSMDSQHQEKGRGEAAITDHKGAIDTQAPLVLSTEKVLLQDLLAIHMVRNTEENVIISYHHNSQLQKTTAKLLQSLVQRTGDSVYWQKLYAKSEDPTLVFLAILWYALYAWDEALEVLYAHLSKKLESSTDSEGATHIEYTRELHKLQAHLLYYQQLLRDFTKSVEFVRDTDNLALYHDEKNPEKRKEKQEKSKKLLTQEAETLLSEIARLDKQREIQSNRLKNAMDLAFATVNIEDSRSMQRLTKATTQDSAAMKRISYLTMIFLPATYLSSVFGMNVQEINPGTLETLPKYVWSTIILTTITAWVVIALQDPSHFHPGGRYVVRRLGWPFFYFYHLFRGKGNKDKINQPDFGGSGIDNGAP